MSDSEILDELDNWATGYLETLTPCTQEVRTYADAMREVAAILAARVWLDSDGVPVEPDDPNAVTGA